MARRQITLAVLAATAMFALALPALVGSQGQHGANRVDRCVDDGGRTLTASRSIRVYITRNRLGSERLRHCWVKTGAAATIRSSGEPVLNFVPEYRIAGRYIGFTRVDFDIRPVTPGVRLPVVVKDARRNLNVAWLFAQPPTNDANIPPYVDAEPGVTDLELSSEGAVAWIVSGRPDDDDYFYVQKADGTVDGQVVLDEGPGIDPRSLAISGRRIYWTNRDQARSAVLQGRAGPATRHSQNRAEGHPG